LGTIGLAGSNYFYYTSIKFITVATAILLQYTTPFLVLVYAFTFHLEKFHYMKLFLLFFAFIALFFAISGGDLNYFSINFIGVSIGILSAFTWAFYNIFNKKIKNRYNDYTELLYIVGSASLLWILINPSIIHQLIYLSPNDILVLFSFAVISVLIPMFCYNSGLKYLKATQATTIGLCEPVVVVFTAFYILGEDISFIQAVSGAIVLLSIYFLEYFRRRIDVK
jgi:drug/metabolite transporter (DMT)-like permease